MTTSAPARLLLLAGTSEAGKSTAGAYLDTIGGRRTKIRPILLRLTTGVETTHEGVATREGFDPADFINALRDTATSGNGTPLAVESFIDAGLAAAVKTAWPTPCLIVFITAPPAVRIRRLAAAEGLPLDEAAQVVRGKDQRKHVREQTDAWRALADHWIDNTGPLDDLTDRLRRIFTLLTA